jgi:3-dehydroquinate dehydratase/shikimate dehydrogenase
MHLAPLSGRTEGGVFRLSQFSPARGVTRATLVASLTEPPSADGRDLVALSAKADWLEVRADLVGDLDPDWLRQHFAGKLLYTLRSKAEWGAFEGSRDRRRKRIAEKGSAFDLVDLEADRDLAPEVLKAIAPEKRIVSWHGPAADERGLAARLLHLTSAPAAFYKMVPRAANAGEELAPLNLLAASRRRDLIAFAGGEPGYWTRIVAPRLGAPVVYGSASEKAAAPGQPSIERLRADYGLPELRPARWILGVVGFPALHSLSPRLHNAAYRALDLPALFVPFDTSEFGDFWLELVDSDALERLGLKLGGLAITTPHKEVAFAVAGATSPLAGRLEAVNTLTPRDGVWEGESTDGEGVVEALRARGVEPKGRNAVVIGRGGAGRAAALGLVLAGASVTLANRGAERGGEVAKRLGLPFVELAELDASRFDLFVNATPLGRREGDLAPVPVPLLPAGSAVVDLVYGAAGAAPTGFVVEARARGLVAVDGREVLLRQAAPQFRLMTGRNLPLDVAARAIGLEAAAAPAGAGR